MGRDRKEREGGKETCGKGEEVLGRKEGKEKGKGRKGKGRKGKGRKGKEKDMGRKGLERRDKGLKKVKVG